MGVSDVHPWYGGVPATTQSVMAPVTLPIIGSSTLVHRAIWSTWPWPANVRGVALDRTGPAVTPIGQADRHGASLLADRISQQPLLLAPP